MTENLLRVSLVDPTAVGSGTPMCAVAVDQSGSLPSSARALDLALGGALERALSERHFLAGRDETFHLLGPAAGPGRVLLVGMGKPTDLRVSLKRAAAIAARKAREGGAGSLVFFGALDDARCVEFIAVGLLAGSWEYRALKTPPPESERRDPLKSAAIVAPDDEPNRAALDAGLAVGTGQSLARTLGMMPGNLCTPEFLAGTASDLASRHGMSVTIRGREELEAEGMRAMLAVAQGTSQDPKLIVVEYAGAPGGERPVVLVGKGICFDTGGISIKPAQGMEMMKFDMSGAGGVLGAMDAIGRLRPRANVVGIIGATTNMPSGTAVKPGDVVQAHSGRFIEIINTDAEGRLLLADLLSYARRFNPAAVIDAATLTGAVVIALGNVATGVFGTDAHLVRELLDAGRTVGEPSWELPLWEDYRELIKSDVADVRNTGGRPAGSITAALFLKDFALGFPWVHLDIAGTAYSETDLTAIPKGPTGVPVSTFVEYVRARAG